MGAWGHGPWENDSSRDWYYNLSKFLKRELKKELRHDGFNEIVDIVQVILDTSDGCEDETLWQTALNALNALYKKDINGDTWFDNWYDVKPIKSRVRNQQRKLKNLLARYE